MWLTRFAFALLLLLAMPMDFLWGQTSAGALVGLVRDPAGAVIPATSITVTNTQTGVTFPIQTDDSGNYFVPGLLPGTSMA